MTKKITKGKKRKKVSVESLKPLPEEDRYTDAPLFGLGKAFRIFDRVPPWAIAGQGLVVSAVICWFVGTSDALIATTIAIGSILIWGSVYVVLKRKE
ncbi:MAG: hypothetical protein DKT66_18635 [Candidatus Melainabacteria bacterium]|nr:MAG: hypothetical protein DKT66_18635 [Candidatus Melainabacteria bacterium]